MSWERVCVCAALQATPSLRNRLASPATSRERGLRPEQDAPMQLQAGRGRALVRSCRVRATRHQNLRVRMVNARPAALTRLEHRPASCRPICANGSACKPHVRCATHPGCMCPAGSGWMTSGKPPAVACVCGTAVIVRIRSRLQHRMAPACSSPRCSEHHLHVCWAASVGSSAGERGSAVELSVRMRDWFIKASK